MNFKPSKHEFNKILRREICIGRKVLNRRNGCMAVILKRKLVFQYEKNSKINILSDNFRVLAWKFSTSFRKINSFVAVVYFFLRLLSHLMK